MYGNFSPRQGNTPRLPPIAPIGQQYQDQIALLG